MLNAANIFYSCAKIKAFVLKSALKFFCSILWVKHSNSIGKYKILGKTRKEIVFIKLTLKQIF